MDTTDTTSSPGAMTLRRLQRQLDRIRVAHPNAIVVQVNDESATYRDGENLITEHFSEVDVER